MSAALLSLAERAAQGLGRGDLSQVYIEGEHGTVFLVSAQDEGVLIAVTSAGAKVGMMLYEVKLAANRVGEVLHGPVPLPAPLPSHVTRGYLEDHHVEAAAEPAPQPAPVTAPATMAEVAASYAEQAYTEQAYTEELEQTYPESPLTDPAYADPGYSRPGYNGYAAVESLAGSLSEAAYEVPAEPAPVAEPSPWSSYAPSGSVLPGERNSWS
jgi:hypothetical protein